MVPVLFGVLLALSVQAQDSVQFFENRIRPLLAQNCYACHGPKLASGNLRLDTREGTLRGGNRGPAVVPHRPDSSILLRAVSHTDAALKMPPAGKLSDRQIADLTTWIETGAADPRETAVAASPATELLWSLVPFQSHTPPKVRDGRWPRSDIDRFLLARLEQANLRPAAVADPRLLLRRVTFDVTGLPPTPAEIRDFLADRSPRAYEKVVDRLLASPHYGERWARHWLDLARYAETDGHEFDREKPNAWRYRDYVIRAFNEDLPYDRFIREQIAGDLDPAPRQLANGLRESPIGTTIYALGEERNAADDLSEVRAEKLDNQIDVFGKGFLGLTIACARCHDHKFDPISNRDYYAIAGVLDSKRMIQVCLDSPEHQRKAAQARDELAALRAIIRERSEAGRPALVERSGDYLLAAAGLLPRRTPPTADEFATAAKKADLDVARLKAWHGELGIAVREPNHILHRFARLARPPEPDRNTVPPAAPRPDILIADFRRGTPSGWRADGPAFERLDQPPAAPATGFLTSPTFVAPRRYMHVRLSGQSDTTSARQPGLLRVSMVGDGRDVTVTADATGTSAWKTANMDKAAGERVFVEIADRSRTGTISVERIVLSDSREPPVIGEMPPPVAGETLAELAANYERLFTATPGLVPLNPEVFTAPDPRFMELAAQFPESTYGFVSFDEEPHDVRIQMGGNHRNLGPEVPRGFVKVLAPVASNNFDRRALASAIASGSNPLTARVIVNRVWQHHFGEGLVRTPDNFGRTGERPTHPELLDTLAARFVANGWSLKKLHREILLSSAYRMSSSADPKAAAIDGGNRLLHHFPVRRLEAESVRDAILAVSGSLDPTLHGPSVPPHVSPYQDGRGKPAPGPVDGANRRSIYIGVRRNFLPPLFTAFDYPPTVTAIGKRGSSTVPSQALILMNNEFVAKKAEAWADRLSAISDTDARITAMYESAFARGPTSAELESIRRFLQQAAPDRAWADVAHVLFNAKEFIFIR